MSKNPVLSARGRYGALMSRKDTPPEVLSAAKRDLAAVVLERHVQEVIADAPPLTDDQKNRIIAILMAGVK